MTSKNQTLREVGNNDPIVLDLITIDSSEVILDLESNSIPNSIPNPIPNTFDLTYKQNSEEKPFILLSEKICIILTIFILTVPFIISDLYYGFSEDSCLTQNNSNGEHHGPRNKLNLKTFLQVDGFVSLFSLIFYSIKIMSIGKKQSLSFCLMITYSLCVSFFYVIWVIIGGVIFWMQIDNKLCSNSVYNYLFISLYLKYSIGYISHVCVFGVFYFGANDK